MNSVRKKHDLKIYRASYKKKKKVDVFLACLLIDPVQQALMTATPPDSFARPYSESCKATPQLN